MSNLAIKINLSRMPGVMFSKLTGKTGQKKDCVIIPVEDCHLFVGEKGVYLDLSAYELREQKYADTHMVKQSFSKELIEDIKAEIQTNNPEFTEAEIQNILNSLNPIIGGIKPFEKKAMQADEIIDMTGSDDLPF